MGEFYLANEYWFAVFQLVFAMLGMGATLTPQDFARVLAAPRAVAFGTLLQLLCVPFVAFLFIQMSWVSAGVAIGIALIAAIPGGTVSNIFTYFARGNSALSISLTAITTIACLVTTPFILGILIVDYMPAHFEMPSGRIAVEICLTLLLPLVLGMAFLKLSPNNSHAFSTACIRASLLGILLIVIGSGSAGRLDINFFGMNNALTVLLFTVLLVTVAVTVPRLLRLASADTIAIEIEMTLRNVNLGVMIKASLFPAAGAIAGGLGDIILLTLLLFGGLQLAIGGLLIAVHRRSRSNLA
ncbi:MAG: bile acid:sodium symporter family protein [Pseudomonadales bacterium]